MEIEQVSEPNDKPADLTGNVTDEQLESRRDEEFKQTCSEARSERSGQLIDHGENHGTLSV
jgi:hypothetical protein